MFGEDNLYNGGNLLWRFLPWRWRRRAGWAFLAAILLIPGFGFSAAVFLGRMETKPLVNWLHQEQARLTSTTTTTSAP